MLFRTSFIFICLGLLSCSTPSAPTAELGRDALDSANLEIYAARGHFAGSDFEHFKLNGRLLWNECGVLHRTSQRSASQNLTNSQTVRLESGISAQAEVHGDSMTTLSDASAQHISFAVSKIVEMLRPDSMQLEAPGSPFRFSGPGYFELSGVVSGQKVHVLTTFDSVGHDSQPTQKALRKLYEALRGATTERCGNETLFSVGLSKPS